MISDPERSYGVRVGPRLHFGEPNDAATYRHNLFGFFQASSLRKSFEDDRFPDERDEGEVLGFGLRYDYSNVYWFDDPSDQRNARLFVDWYDHAFGSDYGFVRFGGLVSATTPLIGYRTIGAVELLTGFEQPLSGRGVPVQRSSSVSVDGSRSAASRSTSGSRGTSDSRASSSASTSLPNGTSTSSMS